MEVQNGNIGLPPHALEVGKGPIQAVHHNKIFKGNFLLNRYCF